MWEGSIGALAEYGIAIATEWRSRGFKDVLLPVFEEYLKRYPSPKPRWFGDDAFHSSHRSNLLRKDRVHYSQFGWTELPFAPYIWPEP